MFSNNLTTTFSYLSLETRTYINRLATKLNGLKRNFGKLMIYLEPGDEWPNVIVAYPDPRNPCWYCEIFDSTDWSEEALNGTINLPIFINRLYKMRENVNYDSPLMQIVIYVRGKLVFDDPMFLFRRIPTVLYERGGYHLNNEGRNDTINQLLNMTEFDKKTFLDFLKRIRFYPIEYIRDFDRLDRYNAILTQAFNPGIATESFDAIFTKIDSCFENGSNKDCDFDVNLELFRGYQIHFAVHPELLVEFFKSTTKRILYIKTESSFLTILRIIDLLSKEEIFLPSRNKFNFTECLTYWLNSHHNIFIIEDTTSMETMLSELSLVLSRDSKFSNSNKKVILVNQSHQISNNALQTIDSFDDKGWFTDLSEDVQNYLVTREISFQGFYVKLEDVLDKNTLLKTLDAPTLERLIQGWKLTIDFTNKFTHMFPDTLKRTLRRQLVNRDVLNSDFLSNNLVLLSNITAEGLSKLKIEAVPYSECENHKSGLFIFNNSEENLNKFHKLCGDRTEKAIYWLEYKESKEREESLLFLKDFSGNTDSFLENLEDLPFSEEMEVHTYVPNNKVNIVTALPGMRKNEFVRGYLSGAFKLNNLTYWVFFDIFLENEGLDRLSKQFLNKFDYSRLIIFCNFENLVKLKTQDVVVKQIQYLASKKCTIWITCDLESRVKVQILLQTAAYRINPLKGPEKFYYFVKETCGHYYDVIPDWTKTSISWPSLQINKKTWRKKFAQYTSFVHLL
ncbi:uncharacterized protein LOC115878482 isoform X2 [Sitophilus oryzae]|uniref:Uncharacterized protein LOC115878482 isoform X2 n=1 Tax=Sitophilus oryzae TaxID=7048 RepID=A0A6J2XJM3_SITOR|nr:uncharacterized protein LOC115878482 isoform X2 [Sitophilus oryzae]